MESKDEVHLARAAGSGGAGKVGGRHDLRSRCAVEDGRPGAAHEDSVVSRCGGGLRPGRGELRRGRTGRRRENAHRTDRDRGDGRRVGPRRSRRDERGSAGRHHLAARRVPRLITRRAGSAVRTRDPVGTRRVRPIRARHSHASHCSAGEAGRTHAAITRRHDARRAEPRQRELEGQDSGEYRRDERASHERSTSERGSAHRVALDAGAALRTVPCDGAGFQSGSSGLRAGVLLTDMGGGAQFRTATAPPRISPALTPAAAGRRVAPRAALRRRRR